MLESTPRSTLYHVYNRRYERSCKKVFDLDFQGHAIKKEFFHYHRWIPWPRKHTHEKYFWKIRTGRPKSRGVVPPLGVRRWIFTLGICGLTDCYIFAQLFRSFEVDNIQLQRSCDGQTILIVYYLDSLTQNTIVWTRRLPLYHWNNFDRPFRSRDLDQIRIPRSRDDKTMTMVLYLDSLTMKTISLLAFWSPL